MFQRRSFVLLLLMLSVIWFSGCRDRHAQSVPAHQSARAAQSSTPPVAKHALRDSTLSTYHNPNYGVSFRYPRNYFLNDASESEDSAILEARQQLAAKQPGATLVAIVTIPPDAYPNTTFRSGSLQLIVNPVVMAETCQSFAAPLDDAYTSGSAAGQGIIFQWRQTGSAAMGTGYLNRDYAGFSNGTCYELFLQVVVGSNPELEPNIKDVDVVKIMRQLDKIVSTLQIHPHAPAASPLPLPVVNFFTTESIPHAHLQNVVRVSWDISGAAENEVFLRVNGPGAIRRA